MSETGEALDYLARQVGNFAQLVNVAHKEKQLQDLEARMSGPDFWSNQEKAQETIAKVKAIKNILDPYQHLLSGVQACRELLEIAEADRDQETIAEVQAEIARLSDTYDRLEVRLALSGPYDACNVYLTIQAGAGGVESMDWAAMLLRMYGAYAQRNGYKMEVMEVTEGEEAGIKTATAYIQGDMAYGFLKSEMGTHRLVRMSPFNAQGKRQTSFSAVEITPEIPESELDMDSLPEKDFRIDTYRASGAGGQHVNKTDSAVRITHLPTGVAVSCQTERSQVQNKLRCWKLMAAKLQQLKESERLDELKALQGERGTIGWGHQIRSYVLQPSQLVTDLRSRLKESNALRVLDGDLQPFIDAYLRWRLKGAVAGPEDGVEG